MNPKKINIAFYGSSLLSAYWNGAATYYRGIIKELHELGHQITFFEPNAFDRQQHRDITEPNWAKVTVYQPKKEDVQRVLGKAKSYDIIIKASGVGVFDSLLEQEVLSNRKSGQYIIFWDVDAPATLARMNSNPDDSLRKLIPEYDLILTYGGGPPVVEAYEKLGAAKCIPINNALDPDTHFPVPKEEKYESDLSFLGNRLPDREKRMDTFFFSVAESIPEQQFLLGGSGWEDKVLPENIRYVGHVYTKDHNAFNASAKAVLNINRESMAKMGYSPATRVFEAAGAGACIITDAWKGVEEFLTPGEEILVAKDGQEVAGLLDKLTPKRAKKIGEAARKRVLAEHTYAHRARKLAEALHQEFESPETVTTNSTL